MVGAVAVLALSASGASATSFVPGVPPSFCSGTGAAAGECGELKGIAVDASNGDVYVVDQGNFRVDEFDSSGTFVRAFGADVVSSGQHDLGTTSAEVCEPANTPPTETDVCKAGVTTASIVGAFGTAAKGIAVDPVTHVVYVVTAAARVAFFDGETGKVIGQTEGNAGQINAGTPEKFSNAASVAVDSSNPLQHYLYVSIRPGASNPGVSKIDKFAVSPSKTEPPVGVTAGSYVCQITGTETATSINGTECGGNGVASHKNGAFLDIDAGSGATGAQNGGSLAVDAGGNLFIAEASSRKVVSEFDSAGNFVTQFSPAVTGHPGEPRPEAVAILPSGNLLVAVDGAAAGSGGAVIQEFDPTSISPANPPASVSPIAEFGSGTIGGSLGIAPSAIGVYVADKPGKKVWNYAAVASAPDVVTEDASDESKTTATLHGSVNPNYGEITDCHFEYGLDESYGQSAPCVPADPGAGGAPIAVSAAISGLAAETSYQFRLVAENAVASTPGSNLEFTTKARSLPVVKPAPGAIEITQTTAKVSGTVNPNGLEITDCHFVYGTTTAYGSTTPCVPASLGSGTGPVDVTASLSGLQPNMKYNFQIVATNEDGTAPEPLSEGVNQEFKTLPDPPTAVTVGATEIGQVAARANGTVNPRGAPATDCHIDYGTTLSYGNQKPCEALPGSGTAPVEISALLGDLAPSTLYHFRVVASNGGGTTNGSDQTFVTMVSNPPGAVTRGSSAGPGGTFALEGGVNPSGLAVLDCHFAYGTSSAYGSSAPCIPSAADLGTGDSELTVTAATGVLEPNTTYHFRLIASNLRGVSQGKDRTFTTDGRSADACSNASIRAEQGIEVSLLPDCMALEQVSPPKKANQPAKNPTAIAADGNRVLFNSSATLGSCPNVHAFGGDLFVGARDQNTGWGTVCVNPPAVAGFDFSSYQAGFTPDLSGWFQVVRTPSGLRVYQEGVDGLISPISPALTDLADAGVLPGFEGSSADHSYVYVSPEPRESGGRDNAYIPGDPLPEGQGEDANLYVARRGSGGQPELELVARDADGKAWGGNCGARLGGVETLTGLNSNLKNGNRNQGAISADGSRVYLSTRPDQPASGMCSEANKKRIMVREETPAGPEIKQLISSECDRVSPLPLCSTTDGDDVYQGASVDQTRVYFTSSRQLTNADRDGGATSCDIATAVSGCDLYLYDANRPAGNRLIDVSAGSASAATPGVGASVRNSITAISADGSHAYFVARSVLTTTPNPEGAVAQAANDNLYLYSYPEEKISFVGTLVSSDGGSQGVFGGRANWENGAYAVPLLKRDSDGKEVGGDGHVLLFVTRSQLSQDDTDAAADIYRYDANAGTLVRVSKAVPGGSDNEDFDVTIAQAGSTGTDYAEQGRWASEDGATVAFTTADPLLPGDTNGTEDSYLWRYGQLFHLPGSSLSSSRATAITPILSYDGSTVAYHSSKRLTDSDGDSVEDVYVLRPGGGFKTPPKAECEGEACQGAPGSGPGELGATSGSFTGAGNFKSGRTACPKGKRKVKRGGKVRCVKPPKHKKQASKKRAGAKQGGQK
jgi:hypothetical protein